MHCIYQHTDLKTKFIICGDDQLDQLESYGFVTLLVIAGLESMNINIT